MNIFNILTNKIYKLIINLTSLPRKSYW